MKDNQSGNWMVVVKEEGFFGKIKGFFKKIFRKNKFVEAQSTQPVEQIKEEPKIEKTENEPRKTVISTGLQNIKVDISEETRILQLQKQVREGKITEADLSDEDIIKVKRLYEKQIAEIKKRIEKIMKTA